MYYLALLLLVWLPAPSCVASTVPSLPVMRCPVGLSLDSAFFFRVARKEEGDVVDRYILFLFFSSLWLSSEHIKILSITMINDMMIRLGTMFTGLRIRYRDGSC